MVEIYQVEPDSNFLDEHELYYRVLKKRLEDIVSSPRNKNDIDPHPKVFRIDDPNCLSTNWSKYSTPGSTLRLKSNWNDFKILVIGVHGVRSIESLRVYHDPIQPTDQNPKGNRAHSCIGGFPTLKRHKLTIRRKLAKVSKWNNFNL